MQFNIGDACNEMTARLESWANQLVVSLPNVIIAILVFIATLMLSKYISRFALKLLTKSSLQQSMKNMIAKVGFRIGYTNRDIPCAGYSGSQ